MILTQLLFLVLMLLLQESLAMLLMVTDRHTGMAKAQTVVATSKLRFNTSQRNDLKISKA